MDRKGFALRYPPEIEECITNVVGLSWYKGSKNMGIIHALQIASKYVKKIKEKSPKKKDYDLGERVEKALGIQLYRGY